MKQEYEDGQKYVYGFKEDMIGYIYQHFKGALYVVIDVALQTESLEPLVIYRSYPDLSKCWARPLSMFLSDVDFEKYPDTPQEYRFQRTDMRITRLMF